MSFTHFYTSNSCHETLEGVPFKKGDHCFLACPDKGAIAVIVEGFSVSKGGYAAVFLIDTASTLIRVDLIRIRAYEEQGLKAPQRLFKSSPEAHAAISDWIDYRAKISVSLLSSRKGLSK